MTSHRFENKYFSEEQADKAIAYFQAKLPGCLVVKTIGYTPNLGEQYFLISVEIRL